MSKLMTSASKIVFILMALGAIIGFFIGKLEAADFMLLCGMAFSFYFSHKGETAPTDSSSTSIAPYAGK